jgi:DNA-binding NarL/FixJ family response regulator
MSELAGKPLTAREQQVAEYLCLGWQNKEIAEALHISHRTVEDHRNTIYEKMVVRNVVELVRKVYKIGEYA